LAHMTVPAGAVPAGGRAVALRLGQLRIRRPCCQDPRSRSAFGAAAVVVVLPAVVGILNGVVDLCLWSVT